MKRKEIPDSSYQYYKQFAKDLKPLSPEEETYICKRIANGDDAAREMLVLGYLYLAEKLALDKVTQLHAFSMADDLIGAAVFGLTKAVNTFVPEKTPRFYSYAMSAINNEIQDELFKSNPIHIEETFFSQVYTKVRNFCNKYAAEHDNTYPTMNEVCEELDITPEQYRLAMETMNASTVQPLDMVVEARPGREEDVSLEDAITDPDSTRFEDEFITKEIIRDALSCLAERDREIITLRFGLNGGKEMSRDELANLFGTTPNNITKRVTASLTKMQKHLTREERNSCDER